MHSCKTCNAARATILGTLGFLAAYLLVKNIPDLARYIKISRM
jgi:hypothetical protein